MAASRLPCCIELRRQYGSTQNQKDCDKEKRKEKARKDSSEKATRKASSIQISPLSSEGTNVPAGSR
jgi:hypothetical protein